MCHRMSEAYKFGSLSHILRFKWPAAYSCFHWASLPKGGAKLSFSVCFLAAQGPKAGGGYVSSLFLFLQPAGVPLRQAGWVCWKPEFSPSNPLRGKCQPGSREWGDVSTPQPTTDSLRLLLTQAHASSAGFVVRGLVSWIPEGGASYILRNGLFAFP